MQNSTTFHINIFQSDWGATYISNMELAADNGATIQEGSSLYFGSLKNNIDSSITRTIDGIL